MTGAERSPPGSPFVEGADASASRLAVSAEEWVPREGSKRFRLATEPHRTVADAAAAVEAALGAGVECDGQWTRYCSISHADYISFLSDAAGYGLTGTLGSLGHRLMAGRGGLHGDYAPDTSHYVMRRCQWPGLPIPTIGLNVYMSSLYERKGRRWNTYPPSPLTGTLFAAVPGRSPGEFVFTNEAGQFVANPQQPHADAFLAHLNQPDALRLVSAFLGQDVDRFRDKAVQRSYDKYAPRTVGPERGVDGYFLPTVFASDWLRFDTWSTYPSHPSGPWGSRRKAPGLLSVHAFDPTRYFTIALTPWRDHSIVIMNWPVVTSFDRKGRIEAVQLSLDFAKHFLVSLADQIRAIASPAPPADNASEQLGYWTVANRLATQQYALPRDFHLPVPPLEWMLGALSGDVA